MRLGWITVQEDDCKKTTKLMSSLHMSCLCKTFFPLAIILKKATGKAGSFEGWMQFILICPKITIRFYAFDNGQEGPVVKVLSGRRVDKVLPPNDVTLTMGLPLPCFLDPNKPLGKIMVDDTFSLGKVALTVNHSVRGVFLQASSSSKSSGSSSSSKLMVGLSLRWTGKQ